MNSLNSSGPASARAPSGLSGSNSIVLRESAALGGAGVELFFEVAPLGDLASW